MNKKRIEQFIKEFQQIEELMGDELKDASHASDLLMSLLCEEVSLDEFWEDYVDSKENAPKQDFYVHF